MRGRGVDRIVYWLGEAHRTHSVMNAYGYSGSRHSITICYRRMAASTEVDERLTLVADSRYHEYEDEDDEKSNAYTLD